jgi:hypothetical protein
MIDLHMRLDIKLKVRGLRKLLRLLLFFLS